MQELQRDDPGATVQRLPTEPAGWVHLQRSAPLRTAPYVAFASQVLPDPKPVRAESVQAWARSVAALVQDRLRDHAGPWRLHGVCITVPQGSLRPRRWHLIEHEVMQILKKKQRRLLRTLLRPNAPWQPNELLVQCGLHDMHRGCIAFCDTASRTLYRRVISPFAAGHVEVADDRRPPARAYRKLLEAQAHMGCGPRDGDTCVDLGAAPGSWTYVALAQGAQVTAVDRSPLRDDLMDHPRCDFVRGDAFKFMPKKNVTWLLCDVIAFPQRSVDLLDMWLTHKRCQRFVLTLKFRGEDDYPVLQVCKAMLQRHGVEAAMRALRSNKNEVTVYTL